MSTHPTPPPECPAHAAGAASGGLYRLHGPEAEADPMGLYEKLRAEHGPVAPVLVSGDLPAWLVLGHRENLDVARTPSRFARDPRGWRDLKEGRVPADTPLGPMVSWVPVCNFTDGAVHERLRGAVTESLERFDKRGIRRFVTRFANQLVDRIAADGEADLVPAFSDQLPMLVMTQLVGAPDEHGPRLVKAARDMLQGTETALQSDRYVTVTLEQLVLDRKAQPARDLASWLLEHPANLSDTEVLMHLRVVLIAAYETTANLIANTLRTVLTDQRFRASLSGGHMTLPDALEQVLWDDPPINTIIGRWATGDTLLGGRQIKAGDMLLLGLAAGNADPQIRPDPAASVRGNRSHLAFSSGPHECPGQDIGRAIADTGIEVLMDRLPDLQLAVDASRLQWRGTLMSRHLQCLPVRFAPRPVPDDQPEPPPHPHTQPEQPAGHPGHAVIPPQPTAAPAPAGHRRELSWWRRLLGRR
ncbi:cytochrome P450 [Streptomyces subrutilus]|uniref:Cytochrome P450 n=1 Tax=Streptomyces subrutilus TaxID=36818 RepID=A0A918RE17_9ACTN|nr:cytochrome P450 [Streptomyces subrutilus]GGZ95414.1 cytochrome P450 [Streptomyces subrutilus]